ncbi:MAG: type II toxin-antitoxin system PemK/MazF family toxin [Microcystis aeruginosa L211-07]|nr:type II toxin-antitoxin system PemK/MazF family toxin [Microcystis aeruginosa L211-07]
MNQVSIFYKKVDVVYAPFPYQDNPEEEKERPVLILAPVLAGKGFICAYITSNSNKRSGMIEIKRRDFKEGHLDDEYKASYVKPDRISTIDRELFRRKCGTLRDEVVDAIIQTLIELLQKPPQSPPSPKSIERPPKPKKKNF